MKKTYNGNDIFQPYNFGLYGIDDYSSDSSLRYQETKDELTRVFIEKHGAEIQKTLATYGLSPIKYEYYSPRFYNYQTDSLDLTVEVTNPELYIIATESPEFRARVQALCDANKSYPGYMALTADEATESINNMDACTMQAILTPIFKDITEEDASEFLYENLQSNYACDYCHLIHEDMEDYGSDEDKATVKKCEATNKN